MPSSAKNWASSVPVEPPPTTMRLLGGRMRVRTSLGVRHLTFSRFLISGMIGVAPEAIRNCLPVILRLSTLIS